jgi:hypothetical protein
LRPVERLPSLAQPASMQAMVAAYIRFERAVIGIHSES